MRKTFGSAVIIDTNPRPRSSRPYREWDGNQGTYLFFPIFIAFVLVLLSNLSDPIIHGLSVVKVDTGVNGTLSVGAWGWCAKGVRNVSDVCSTRRGFGEAMDVQLAELPGPLHALAGISTAIPASYMVTNGVFHLYAALSTWLTVTWALAASGSWGNKQQIAWCHTKWAFRGTYISTGVILIAWAIDLGLVTRISSKAINVDGSQPKVTPGPAIWMMMIAFMLTLTTSIVRLVWLRRMPRPLWTIKSAGDFHDAMQPPMSAALPPPDEQPPTWESLGINPVTGFSNDEKIAVDENEPSIDQRGFAV